MQISGAASSNALWISASGLNDANIRAATVAHNVANVNTDGFVPDRVNAAAIKDSGVRTSIERTAPKSLPETPREAVFSQTDLPTEMTNLLMAKRAYQANAKVIETGDESWKGMFGEAADGHL